MTEKGFDCHWLLFS